MIHTSMASSKTSSWKPASTIFFPHCRIHVTTLQPYAWHHSVNLSLFYSLRIMGMHAFTGSRRQARYLLRSARLPLRTSDSM